jgi:hypothetical protein
MKISKHIAIGILAALGLGCTNRPSSSGSQEAPTSDSVTVTVNNPALTAFAEKSLPLVDSTNFDNLTDMGTMTPTEIQSLQLSEMDFAESSSFTARYRINLTNEIISLVVTYWASDVEMHTYLINYDSNMNRIDQLPISYDEIAESYIRKHARITDANNIIVVSENSASGEVVQTETKFRCLNDGTFVQTK